MTSGRGGLVGLAVVVTALVLGAPSTAHAMSVSQTIFNDQTRHRTELAIHDSLDCTAESPCDANITFTLHGEEVDEFGLFFDGPGQTQHYAYRWDCAQTGYVKWKVELQKIDDPNTTTDESQQSPDPWVGSFYVGPCSHGPKLWRVPRSHAAWWAASGWDSEFVSSSRCHAHKRKSSKWTCVVTHNNSYRECRTRFVIWFFNYVRFGVHYKYEWWTRKGLGCRYF